MRILAVGGGSGGHVTPVVAVLRVIKQRHPKAEIRFWCDRKFYAQAKSTLHHFDETVPVDKIWSGKLRRYNTLSLWQQLRRPDIMLPNIRDLFFVFVGCIQSFFKLIVWRPDVVFTKGGFVCLPVGLAARLLRIPLVIHDSDAHPGLTNRILARFATTIATGAPLTFYNYPKDKSHYVGIPVAAECVPFTADEQAAAKQELGFNPAYPLVVVTGGGLGARRINEAVLQILPDLLPDTSVLLIAGAGQYDELLPFVATYNDQTRFQLHAFVTPLVPALGAADVVVSRAGATTLLELAAMAKPTILIPNAYLTGGHQLKNAAVYEEGGAVIVLGEEQLDKEPTILAKEIHRVIDDTTVSADLSQRIHVFAKPHAATDMAELILQARTSRR